MNNRTRCLSACVCCMFYSVIFAQAEWPKRTPIADTSILSQLPGEELSNEPPLIFYQNKPSELVFIDGEPVITVDEYLRMYRILNTPHLIIKNHHDNKYYLYGGRYWYVSDSATYGYKNLRTYPPVIRLIDSLVKQDEKKLAKSKSPGKLSTERIPAARPQPPVQIVVATEPAELIQTKGEPLYKKIAGTSLSYAYNTDDDIFIDSVSRSFFILLSGRWYGSSSLNGPWKYIYSNELPADFSHIPAGSEKARVLAHIKGTDSAREAVTKATMLYTTKVSRKLASVNVIYDGGAEFSSVSNTGLFVSENSNIPVINVKDKYYALQDGVWFRSSEAIGPWEVSAERPQDIDKIPSTHRDYYTRFVYVYDTTADYVYTGYTPGYLNSYVQDSCVVWGTGWPYKSWYRRLYFQRPGSWGHSTYYQPGNGWRNRPGFTTYKGK